MTEAAFIARVRLLEGRMYRMAKTILQRDEDCADAISEALLKAWQKQHTLRDETLFETWLTRILINECRNLQRKHKATLPFDEALAVPDTHPPPDVDLQRSLMALAEKYRLPLILHHMDGYPLKDVGHILGLPVSTVKWRIHHALKTLQIALEEVAT